MSDDWFDPFREAVADAAKAMSDLNRFLRYVRPADNGCWDWELRHQRSGYPEFSVKSKMVLAHRFAYEALVGPIPDGLTLDHLCRRRGCVNPAHLEAVTIGVNVLRGNNPCAINARKARCKNGHEFTEETTYYTRKGNRECRICRREANRTRERARARGETP